MLLDHSHLEVGDAVGNRVLSSVSPATYESSSGCRAAGGSVPRAWARPNFMLVNQLVVDSSLRVVLGRHRRTDGWLHLFVYFSYLF